MMEGGGECSVTGTDKDRKIESTKQMVETSLNPININGSLFRNCQAKFSVSHTDTYRVLWYF